MMVFSFQQDGNAKLGLQLQPTFNNADWATWKKQLTSNMED